MLVGLGNVQLGPDYAAPLAQTYNETGGSYGGTYDAGFTGAAYDGDYCGLVGGKIRFAVPNAPIGSYGTLPYGDGIPALALDGEGGFTPVANSNPTPDPDVFTEE